MLISVAFFIARQFPFLIFWVFFLVVVVAHGEQKGTEIRCACMRMCFTFSLSFFFVFFCCAVERGKWEDSVCTGAEHGK